MAIQYSTTHRTNAMTQLNTDIGTSAQIIIYSGAAPANVAASVTGTLLVQFTGNATQFGTVSSGVLTASSVAGVNAAATGTAGYFRINTSGGTAVVQGTCGTSGTDMILTNTAINSGQACTFTSLTVTASGA
jgi:glyoxylate carboligase